jgi:hypothetical protein
MIKLTHDDKVYRRHIIMEALQQAIDKRDREAMKKVLKRIHATPDFEVVLNYDDEIVIHGRMYGYNDGTILIREDGHRMFCIYKSQDDGSIWIDVSPYDLQTEAEDLAESQWERESESAYEKWLDYKASFDDPRGY